MRQQSTSVADPCPRSAGRPAYLLPSGEGGRSLQATMADGTVLVLQTPGD